MVDFTEQDLLDEIRFDIKVKDRLKAELVLAELKHVKRETQRKALFELSRADAAFSIVLLAGLFVNSPDIAEAFPQLKETMYSKIVSRPDVLQDLMLKEPNPNLRAFLVQMAGRIQIKEAAPVLLDILSSESDPAIRMSAIVSLGMVGDSNAVGPISEFLDHTDSAMVHAATDALGEIGTSEAIDQLAKRLGKDPEMDHKMLDIFSRLQAPEAVEVLNSTLTSAHAHIRVAGKEKLGAIGVMSIRVLLKNLKRSDPDLVIHSLNVLGDIGDATAATAIRSLINTQPDNPNVRFAAYEALGRLPIEKGAFVLAAGLEDSVDNVRAAAAKAIDRNYNALLAGGVRNMTKSNNGTSPVIHTILDAQCDRIVMDLIEEEYFLKETLTYLTDKAHPDTRSFYAAIFSANGLETLAKQVAPKKGDKTRAAVRIYTVDDSKMLLNIYRSILHNLACEAVTFESARQAVTQVRDDRPDVILTDLNMPDMTGIDLAVNVREWFSREELPIIMVTTQQESRDFEAARTAGINGIIHKPFTESQIKEALKKYAGLNVPKEI